MMTLFASSKRYRWSTAFAVTIALQILLCLPAFAQMDQGTITGAVEDNTGAVVPGAQVTLVSTDTGLTLATKADSSGVYTFPAAKIGNYKVTADSPGFKTTIQENIHLNVQDRLNIVLVLQPGSVSQTVTITSAPPLLQTQEASVGQVMSTTTVDNTPLNGRNWVYIAQMAAGVDPDNGARGNGRGDFDANGQRAEENNFILDGVDNNYGGPGYISAASFAVQPPPDALAEFKIQTSDYSAEFGHSTGAVVNASIKSGTNLIHGNLWEYFRNNVLDARDFDALTVPKYRENQFGATLGLPIVRDKLFFFGYAEANRIIFGDTSTSSVPTALMRQGNFSELLNPALTSTGTAIPLYQPGSAGTTLLTCTGQQNVICPGQIDHVAQNILSLYPLPNTNGGKLYNNYTQNRNAFDNTWQWGTRLDWNIGARDQIFARFSYSNTPDYYPPPLGTTLDGGAFGTDGEGVDLAENIAVSETHIFSPTFTNELRYGYNYGEYKLLQVNADTNIGQTLGLGGIPYASSLGGLPSVSLDEISSFGTPGFLPNQNVVDEYQMLDNLMKTVGNHSLKFGVDFQSMRTISLVPPAARGTYTYNDYYTSIPGKANTGYGAADFLLNQITSATLSNANLYHDSRWYRAAYFEDDWKVSRNLTLNLGIRYEFFEPTKELNGRQASFNITGPITPGSGKAVLTYPKIQQNVYLAPAFLTYLSESNVSLAYSANLALANAQLTNFSPRVGFAYSFDAKTVVRGGIGLFYGGLEGIGANGFLENYPFQFTSTFAQPSSCTPGACATNGILLETGFQQALSEGLANIVPKPTVYGIPTNVQTPYHEGYNLTFERTLSGNMVASIGYVGNVDRHLQNGFAANSAAALTDPRLNSILAQPFPLLGSATVTEYSGAASYNSLQAHVEKRYANGLNFLATYTWAHALTDSYDPLGDGSSGYRGPNLIGILRDMSNSSFDVRNRVTFNGFYQLPLGNGRRFLNHSRILDTLVGGWSADVQFAAQTGFPITVATNLGSAAPNGGTAYAIPVRDVFAPGGSPNPSNSAVACAQHTRNLKNWYNPCAFANPPLAFPQAQVAGSPVSTTQITGLAALPYLGVPQLSVPGPGYERVNMSLFKDFRTFREQILEFRTDIFNVLNTPAYGAPSVTTDASTGGEITSARVFQNLTPDARFFQLSAKYVF